MSRKDFDEYYNKIYSQFYSLNEVFEDLSKEVAEGMVEPERQKQLELTIQPIRDSYQTLRYIKYLLDKPAKKSKEPRYKSMNRKLLEATKGYHDEDFINKNDEILKSLK